MKKKLNIEGKNNKKIKNYLNHGASQRKNVFKDMPDVLNSPDVDIGYAKRILMARAREMYKGNSLGLGAIRKIRTNVIGPGLKLLNLAESHSVLSAHNLQIFSIFFSNSITSFYNFIN